MKKSSSWIKKLTISLAIAFSLLSNITHIDGVAKYKVKTANAKEIVERNEENTFYPKERIHQITIHREKVLGDITTSLLDIDIDKVDRAYVGKEVKITGENRDNLERLIQGEAGGEGYAGACLVAQVIKDTMLYEDEYDVLKIKKDYSYSGKLKTEPCEDVKNAVKFVFDEGGVVVNHRLIYFYAPKRCKSKFHESQDFIVEYGGHRFFDMIDS